PLALAVDQKKTDIVKLLLNLGAKKTESAAQYLKTLEIAQLLEEANKGDIEARFKLGMCYEKGDGVGKDLELAVHWIQKAAEGEIVTEANEKKVADAEIKLGTCYLGGFGVVKDKGQAVKWFHRAAERGHADAQFTVGECYLESIGVSEDIKQAEYWLRQATDQGHDKAQESVSRLIKKKNILEQLVANYRKWSDEGDWDARFFLAECLYFGRGCAEDKPAAQKLYAELENKAPEKYRRIIVRRILSANPAAIATIKANAEVDNDIGQQYEMGERYAEGDGVRK